MSSRSKSTTHRITNQTSIDDTVLNGILTVLVRNNGNTWSGTMTDLTAALSRVLGKRRSVILPGSPGALRVVVNRVVNRLRARRISVRFSRTPDHARNRYVRFTR